MPTDSPPLGTYPDERNPIPSAEITANPVWIILSGRRGRTYEAGPWFSRAKAEEHLKRARYRYPKDAHVFCASGHMSADYVHLCETGRIPNAR